MVVEGPQFFEKNSNAKKWLAKIKIKNRSTSNNTRPIINFKAALNHGHILGRREFPRPLRGGIVGVASGHPGLK